MKRRRSSLVFTVAIALTVALVPSMAAIAGHPYLSPYEDLKLKSR